MNERLECHECPLSCSPGTLLIEEADEIFLLVRVCFDDFRGGDWNDVILVGPHEPFLPPGRAPPGNAIAFVLEVGWTDNLKRHVEHVMHFAGKL